MTSRAHDLIGRRFGKLTVVERAGTNSFGSALWRCRCDCGGERVSVSECLNRGKTVSCGCRRASDLTGRRFGKLTVVERAGSNRVRTAMWRCSCDCGGETITATDRLKRGSTVSCGCRRSEAALENLAKNGGPPNRGKTYQIKSDDEVFRSIAGWRDAAIRARGNACEVCGWAEASCDVHHRVPRSRGGKNTITNAIVLCPNHHRIAHEGTR